MPQISGRHLTLYYSYPIGITKWAIENAIPSNGGEDFGNFQRRFPSKI